MIPLYHNSRLHMNKYIKSVISKLFPQKEMPKHMGRWRIEDCHKQVNHRIDLSNEDHCGPCGQYALSKLDFKPTLINKVKEDNTKKPDIIGGQGNSRK